MGLKKTIELDNGIEVSYHRVVSTNIITNNQNVIEVASYLDQGKRQNEIDGEGNVFIHTEYYPVDYDEAMGVPDSYECLKKMDAFADSEDA